MSEIQLKSISDLQNNYKKLADSHLQIRFADNPEFKREFVKTFSDLVFSQNDEMQEKLLSMKQNSLLNAVFKATEAGASFAKKEISLIPYEIFKKEVIRTLKGGVERKIATGKYDAIVIFDINFQKQQILKLQNCKRFFTAEVHDGVKVIEDLNTGNCIFDGENNALKPTVGYYACFITTEGEKYDMFMPNEEIVERAKFSPQFKKENYAKTSNNIHYEKIVVRNLMKEIPKISDELKSILSSDDAPIFEELSNFEVVDTKTGEISEREKVNELEEAKKRISSPGATPSKEPVKAKSEKSVAEVFFSDAEIVEDGEDPKEEKKKAGAKKTETTTKKSSKVDTGDEVFF